MRKAQAYTSVQKGHEFVSQYSHAELVELQHNIRSSCLIVFGIAASEVFESYSQFSPWEFTAAEFNKSRDPDGMWAAFERGMSRGANRAGREIVKAYETQYKAEHPTCIKSLSIFNNRDSWSMVYSLNMGCAVLMHEYDVNGEWVTAQYKCEHGDEFWSTPVKRYQVQYSKPKQNIDGYLREYFVINGMQIWLDGFTWRGGSIQVCQEILLANGTIKL